MSDVYYTKTRGIKFYVAADGPGHAAFQLLGLIPTLHLLPVARQVFIDRGVVALGQAARDAARDKNIRVIKFKLESIK